MYNNNIADNVSVDDHFIIVVFEHYYCSSDVADFFDSAVLYMYTKNEHVITATKH